MNDSIVVIKHVSELPDWFDIKKYDPVKEFNAGDWAFQLGKRNFIQVVIDQNWDDDDLPWKLISRIHGNPILEYGNEEINDFWDDEFKQRPFNSCSLRSLTAMDAYCHLDDRLEDVWAACRRDDHMVSTKQDVLLCREPYDLLMRKAGIDCGGDNSLVVDLNSTDEELITDFKNWLKHYRLASGCVSRPMRYSKKDFDEWYGKGILPFIDLVHWSRLNNTTITQKVLGDVIFPDEPDIDTTERIRKTTKPLARMLLKGSVYKALQSQDNTAKFNRHKNT